MRKVKSKKAFSMVTAIFVIFIMASLTVLIMNVTGKTVKSTTQQYQREQAMLLARSYTELAILYVIYYDRSTNSDCLESIEDHFGNASPNGYSIKIDIKYIGNDTILHGCNSSIDPTGGVSNSHATWSNNSGDFYNTISLVIDTYISYRDIDDSSRSMTYHRRTLQKI